MRKRCNEAGFTLIQISILLTVAALVMVTMLPSSQLSLTANNASVKKMNAVLTALRQYQVANAILPCPADPTVATGNTSYGIAAANSGPATSCVGSTPSAAYADPTKHIAIGMVPYKTLGLSSDYALDGYGRDVTYAVDTNATASCWSSTSLTGGITVNDNGTNNSAVAVMVSHGADGYGAWLPTQGTGGTGTATRLDSGSTDIFQADNAQVNNGTGSGGLTANGAGQFQSFYRKAPTATFDDVVIYQNPQWSLNALPANSRAALTTYPANGSYSSGQILTFIVTLPTAVTFTGTPRLHLSALGGGANSIGTSNAAYATLASGNGTKTLTFTYTIISTDAAASGIAMTSPIDLNGGTATVSNCVLAFAVPNLSGVIIPVPCGPPCIYMTNQGANVSAINGATNTVVATITVGNQPTAIAISGNYAYVANYTSGTVSVINIPADTLATTITVGTNPGTLPAAIAASGGYVYVANWGSSNVSVINTSTNTLATTITTGSSPQAIAISGGYAYVANASSTVSVINTATNTLATTISVGAYPIAIAISGGYAYTTNYNSSNVSVINLATNTVTATITVGAAPWAVAISGNYAYVANRNDGTVSVINLATNTVTATITVGSNPYGIAASGVYVYVANNGSNTVSVINTSTNTVTATLTVGSGPKAIAISGGYAYVANNGTNTVSVINTATNAVVSTITAGSAPFAFATYPSPATQLYIADYWNSRIRKVDTGGSNNIITVAGNGTAGYSGDGGAATSAKLNVEDDVKVDSAGNIYIADASNNRIRKVTAATGVISTVAGTGTGGFTGDGGLATLAQINYPNGIALDSSGNIYFSDYSNNRIRKVTVATGNISTVAGNGTAGYTGDGGLATSAEINQPYGLAVDNFGNIYIADANNNRIRMVTAATGNISTVAGTGVSGYSGDGGLATSAQLKYPLSVAFDVSGNLYIADYNNGRIRVVNAATGIITTVAGGGAGGDGGLAINASLIPPYGVTVDSSNNIYISDQGARVRMVTAATGIITTLAGNGTRGFLGDGGPATNAEMNYTMGIAVSR